MSNVLTTKRHFCGIKQYLGSAMACVAIALGMPFWSLSVVAGSGAATNKPTTNKSKGGQGAYDSASMAMSDLLERSLMASIKEVVTGPFDSVVTKEVAELEKSTKGIDRSNPKNDIFLDFVITHLATELYEKHTNEILKRTKDLSLRSLGIWSRQVHEQLPEKYTEDVSFFNQYAKGLHGMIDGLSTEEHKEIVFNRMMGLMKSQIRNWIIVKSPLVRGALANSEQSKMGDGKRQERMVEGTTADIVVEGIGKAQFTPVDLLIPDVPLEKLVAESPASLRAQKIKGFAKDFSAQTVLFNGPLYWVTLAHVGMDYAKNPLAISQFYESLQDPVSHVGFAAFIAANHKFTKAWMQILPNPKLHHLGSYLGMAMGMTASSLISGFWNDPNIQGCAKSYLKDKDTCQKAYNSWVLSGKINELAPAIGGLWGAALGSAVLSPVIYRATGLNKVQKNLQHIQQELQVLDQFKNNGLVTNRQGVRLDSLHVLPAGVYDDTKLAEYMKSLKLRKLVATSVVTFAGNLIFLAVDPFISPGINDKWQRMQQSSFNMAQFLELNTPLGNLENFGRFMLFGNVKLPHEIDVKTMPQTFSALNKSMDHFLGAGFTTLDPKACLPKRSIPVINLKTNIGIGQSVVFGQRTNKPECFIYTVPDTNKVLFNLLKNNDEALKTAEFTIKFNEKTYKFPFLELEGAAASKEPIPLAWDYDVNGNKIYVQGCVDERDKALASMSMPRKWYGAMSEEYEGLRDCLEQADLPFWLGKYAEVQKDWRTHLISETINASLQWSTTIGDFLTMFNGTRHFYSHIIRNIWEHRRFALAVNKGTATSPEDRKRILAEHQKFSEEVMKGEGTPEAKNLKISNHRRTKVDILLETGTTEEKKMKIADDRERLLNKLLRRNSLLAVAHHFTKVPATSPSEGEADVMDAEKHEIVHVKYSKEQGHQLIPARNEEEMEKYADLYPNSVGDFKIKELSDYLVASMVCGPRAEDRPSILQKFTSLKWLPWESIASVAPSVFSTTKIVEPFSPVLEMSPGMKFELVPPRMTENNEACDKAHWGEINKRIVGRVSRETRESRSPVASKLEKVLEFIESVVSDKPADQQAAPAKEVKRADSGEWVDKSAPLYWQTIVVGGKQYRGVIDYLIDHAREDILKADFQFEDGFVDWYRTVVEDPISDPEKGLWKGVGENYQNLLQKHFFPALTNTELEKGCSDRGLDCGLSEATFIQANGVISSAVIEFENYFRMMRTMLMQLRSGHGDDEIVRFDQYQIKIIDGLKASRQNIQAFDFSAVKTEMESFKKDFPGLVKGSVQPKYAIKKSGLNGFQKVDSNQAKMAVKVVGERIFELMTNVMTEVEDYKKYIETLDLNKTSATTPESGSVGSGKIDPRARISH